MTLPKGRSANYAIFLACERFKLVPPGIEPKWEENTPDQQAELLGYSQIREYEEAEARMTTYSSMSKVKRRGRR